MTQTLEQKVEELQTAVTRLEGILGAQFYDKPLDPSMLKPENTLPNGRYPYMLSDYQLRLGLQDLDNAIADLRQKVAALPSVPTSTQTGGFNVKDALAAYGVHIAPNKIGIGMEPEGDDASALQMGGDAAPCILGVSNTKGTDNQNPGEVHKNTFVVADNDGGMRLRQYLQWVTDATGKVVRKRNTANRRASILALDSQGDLCKSTMEVGSENDGGQSWYIRTEGLVVEFCTYKVGAFLRILKSVAGYGARDEAQL